MRVFFVTLEKGYYYKISNFISTKLAKFPQGSPNLRVYLRISEVQLMKNEKKS